MLHLLLYRIMQSSILLTVLFIFNIRLNSQNIVENVIISTNSLSIKELYNPRNLRNPMIATTDNLPTTLNYDINFQNSLFTSTDTLNNFILSGIIRSDNYREALLKNKSTNEMYILKNGRVYDVKRNVLKNIKGEIKGKSVVLYDVEKKERKELFINDIR